MISFRPLPVMTAAMLIAFAILVVLGNWQMQRLAWKEDLIAQVAERTDREPMPLETVLARGAPGDVRYTPVTVSGQFDHAGEVHLFGRDLDGRPGYYIYTPLRRDGLPPVIVNRGFVPQVLKAPASRPDGQVAGEVQVTGLVRLSRDPGPFQPPNEPGANQWYVANLAEMAAEMGLVDVAPVFVDADAAPNPGGWPLGGQTPIHFSNRHLGYALTWYGLAVVMLGVYIAVHISSGRLAIKRSSL